jgi:hypothetical protein
MWDLSASMKAVPTAARSDGKASETAASKAAPSDLLAARSADWMAALKAWSLAMPKAPL